MITVGPMLLNQPQAPDDMEPFFLGTMSGGGYHTDMSRLSSHDHSGGLMGAAVAVNIPDGSITAADLDPSVLAPYALVDGSKPFTGQVTMQADAIIRDELLFGPQGSAAAPDVHVLRTGVGALRVDNLLGLRATPAAWAVAFPALQLGDGGAVAGNVGGPGVWLTSNAYFDGTSRRQLVAGAAAVEVAAGASGFAVLTSPAVAAGAPQVQTTRLTVDQTGVLTVTADTAVGMLQVTKPGAVVLRIGELAAANHVGFSAPNGSFWFDPAANQVNPYRDNAISNGNGGNRWSAVYAVNGTIQTSSADMKAGITPLDPAACYQAAKDVRWYEYAYLPPAYTVPEPPPDLAYDAADDNETKAEKKAARDEAEAQAREAYARMLVETAPARNQRGFVFPAGAESKDEAGGALPPVPDLFGLSDRESTTPQADLATLGCALQEVIRRLEQLEAPAA